MVTPWDFIFQVGRSEPAFLFALLAFEWLRLNGDVGYPFGGSTCNVALPVKMLSFRVTTVTGTHRNELRAKSFSGRQNQNPRGAQQSLICGGGGGGGGPPPPPPPPPPRPEVQPLILLYTIFDYKGTPFVYLLLTNDTLFTYLV